MSVSEKLSKENQAVRDIVREINNFGINDRQRALLIYQLALELEKAEHVQEICQLVASLNPNIHVMNMGQENTE